MRYINPFKPEFTIVIFIHYKPRLAVDEDDLKWALNGKTIVIIKTVPWTFSIKNPLDLGKLSHSSEMQNDTLMHREDLKG